MTTSTRPAQSGLDLQWVDPETRPQDDLFGHVNGRWLATHEIPDDRAQDGAFRALRDRAEADVRTIVEAAAEHTGPAATDDTRKIADLYRSFMDVERIEAAGATPLRPLLDEITAAADRERTGRAARPRPAHRRPGPVRRVRGHRRQGLHPLPGAPVPVRARAARRVLLPGGHLRRDPRGVRRAPGPAGRAGRPGRAGAAGRDRDGAGDRAGRAVLGPGHQPGRGEDLHADDRRRAAPARARRSTGTPGRPASARRPARSTRSSCGSPASSRRPPSCGRSARSSSGGPGWPSAPPPRSPST